LDAGGSLLEDAGASDEEDDGAVFGFAGAGAAFSADEDELIADEVSADELDGGALDEGALDDAALEAGALDDAAGGC